jgi:hypothetical protein
MLLHYAQQLQRHPAGAFGSGFPFLDGGLADVESAGKDGLGGFVGFGVRKRTSLSLSHGERVGSLRSEAIYAELVRGLCLFRTERPVCAFVASCESNLEASIPAAR